MKYSLRCATILLLISGLLQGCSGVVKMEKVKVGEIAETKEWTDADGRKHTETTVTYIYEEQKKTDVSEDKSDDFWLYYTTLMTTLLLLN